MSFCIEEPCEVVRVRKYVPAERPRSGTSDVGDCGRHTAQILARDVTEGETGMSHIADAAGCRLYMSACQIGCKGEGVRLNRCDAQQIAPARIAVDESYPYWISIK
ncbi:MAG: hypothetical protein MJZ77_08535 [Bacteroidales bacterium]|nr:hypothetical protein [Bacteroidales bacterium]